MVVLPLFYLPPIEYYVILLHEEKVLLEAQENYQKQTYRNRCCIYSPNGKQNLTIPVINKNKPKTTKIEIDNSHNWQKVHWKSIEAAYRSSPFFEFYENKFEPFYSQAHKSLFSFNKQLLELTLELLSTDTTIEQTEEYLQKEQYSKDYRETIHPKRQVILTSPHYHQVFNNKHNFIPNLSIIDLLFNEGPNSKSYLLNCYE